MELLYLLFGIGLGFLFFRPKAEKEAPLPLEEPKEEELDTMTLRNDFDVYRGDKIAEGKKQYALSFVMQDLDKTLTDNDVERVMSKLLSTFQNEFGATLR